jgi:alkyl hydroperoxide reductase subunit F
MAKAFLEKHNIPFTSIDVGEDEEAAKHMIEISSQRGIPVITIDDEIIIGFDAQRLNEIFGTGTEGDILDVLIIGAGPAGLTAAVYCARKLLTAVIITENIGGQALESWTIENYMGYRMITGDELELDQVQDITPADGIFKVHTATDATYQARTIILAPGKQPKKLGVDGEERFLGRGLSVCSTCDGPLFRNKVVAIVGGGNSALQTAVEMSKIAKEVHLIVRSTIRADEVYVKRLEEQKNIILHSNSIVTALHGDNLMNAITIKDRLTSDELKITLDGVFAEIGWSPNTDFVSGLVKLNDQKEIIIDINCHTSIPGIFAAGDVTNIKGKQIIIAAGEGAKAALEAYDYLVQL